MAMGRRRRLSPWLVIVPLLSACKAPTDAAVVDCTAHVAIDTSTAARFLGSLACAWPLIADDRSPNHSVDALLTHGLVYVVVIAEDGVTIPADTGVLVFVGGNTQFADGDVVTATLRAAPHTLTISFDRATEIVSLVVSDETTGGLYRLAKAPPPSPLKATGTITDLMPLATTFSGTVDFASAADDQGREAEPRVDVCAPMWSAVKENGDVDVDIDGVSVSFPYRPRRSSITQFDDAGTEVTELTSFEDDGRRLSLEVLRITGRTGPFTLKSLHVQVAESESVVAEYTQRPAESPCR
jgi:hypothetical protein